MILFYKTPFLLFFIKSDSSLLIHILSKQSKGQSMWGHVKSKVKITLINSVQPNVKTQIAQIDCQFKYIFNLLSKMQMCLICP